MSVLTFLQHVALVHQTAGALGHARQEAAHVAHVAHAAARQQRRHARQVRVGAEHPASEGVAHPRRAHRAPGHLLDHLESLVLELLGFQQTAAAWNKQKMGF